ncbi:MAG: hypothetical protein JWO14_3925 [Solirubrobacterales bacterium]|nr:hypothetical protein [Solirubrobacterales bacterium]
MKRGEGKIDWSTASIAVGSAGQLNKLTVEVTGGLGHHWRQRFQEAVRIHNQHQANQPRPWGNVSLEGSGGTMSKTEISVEDVEPGSEDEVKAQLDHFAKLASQSAVPAEETDDKARAERDKAAKEKADRAAEMEERFRAA